MDRLIKSYCDCCYRKGSVALLHHNGEGVLALCYRCDPKVYRKVKAKG